MEVRTLLGISILTSVLVLGAGGCGKGDSAKSGGGSKKASVDLAKDVNAQLTADAKKLVEFETRVIRGRKFTATVAVPKGWLSEDNKSFPGALKPPKDNKLGWMTGFSIGSGCGGACVPKNWKQLIDKKAKRAVPQNASTKDEVLPENGRIRWTLAGDRWKKTAHVYAAWYTKGASHYRYCTASLEHTQLAAALPAFVHACKTARFAK